MLRKYFCVKNLRRHVIDNYSRDLQASNCAKEFQLNRAEPREVKDNSYKLSTFLLTNLGSRSSRSTKANIGKLHYTEKGTLTTEDLSNLV